MSNKEPKTEFFGPKPGDYIIVKCPFDQGDGKGYTEQEIKDLQEGLQDKFCNNIVIVIPDNIDLNVYEKEELIEQLTNLLKQLEEKVKDDNLHGRIVPLEW